MCPTYCQINRHKCRWGIDIAHHSATCSTNCYDYMQVHCKSRVTWHVLFPCESAADFGIAGEGRSSIEEKSIAKFRRTSGASHHAMSCHNKHATTISAIRHSVEARGGTSIRGVKWCEAARISLEMTDSPPRPGDHDDLGGVEKAEDSQCRHGGLFGSKTYRNLRIQKITGKKRRRLVHDD